MADLRHHLLDIVELRADSGRWPAGTVGTVVEADEDKVLVEISDDRGHGLDLIALPHDAVVAKSATTGDRLAS
jgi:chemotaxis protein histidine kinase CheA